MSRRGTRGLRTGTAPTLARSPRRPRSPLRILRAFLGVTLVFAGLQTLADQDFLHRGTQDSSAISSSSGRERGHRSSHGRGREAEVSAGRFGRRGIHVPVK